MVHRPLFFQDPVPLEPARLGERGLTSKGSYRFAASTNAIPISLSEMAVAAVWYPVVFADEAGARPLVIVGLRTDENLYVDEAGRWLHGAYVPAYVRCYPFILAQGPGAPGPTLCVDDASDLLQPGGRALFRNGAPTKLLHAAFDICQGFQTAERGNAAFVAGLAEHGLLTPRKAQANLGGGKEVQLGGFQTIDEAAFRALPDEVFLSFRRRGWLPAIYAQIASAMTWTRLADLLAERQQV